jgi:hypothetical protein
MSRWLFGALALQLVSAMPALSAPMTNAELAAQRAGIMTPMGIELGFAADVRTSVDGRLALETRLTWTDQGVQTQRTGDLAGLADQSAGRWTGVVPGVGGGQTQIVQDLTNGRIASVILNSASNRNISQETNITLTLPQLSQLQQQVAAGHLSATLQNAMGLALQSSTGAGH